jgi:uncharacterized membrane protein YgdD (TMEM256/DUF423 family)
MHDIAGRRSSLVVSFEFVRGKTHMPPNRPLLFAAGLLGASGVALSAAAAHSGVANVATAASFLLMHASAFLALSVFAGNRLRSFGSWTLLLGLVIFSGDLLARAYLGTRLFPMAAPAGGVLMIGGWLAIAASALVRSNAHSSD